MDDEATYICDACGEEIVIPIDPSAGASQEYVEDCPVCCRANRRGWRSKSVGGRGIRDRQEINWTFWGSSVPQVWSRRLSQTGGVVGYSEDLAIEKRPKMRCNWASKSPSYFLPVPKTENDPESLPVVADRSPDSKVNSCNETILTSPRLQALPEARSTRASGTRRRHQGE